MGTQIETLRDLFIEQGRELYDVTGQEQVELPLIKRQVSNPQLRKLLDRQLSTVKNQRIRVQEALKKLETTPEGEKNVCCQAVFKQTKNLIDRSKNPRVRDAVILNSIQRLNHTKITGLGSLTAYAREIGQPEIASAIHETLDEEKAIDRELSRLAESDVNKKAVLFPAV